MSGDIPTKHRVSFLTVSETYRLNNACIPLSPFGVGTFHVGSSLETADYHDVDLRCMLIDSEFDRMFDDENDPRLKFLNVTISDWIAARTGLPIDFQFQRMSDANEKFKGRRNGVGH